MVPLGNSDPAPAPVEGQYGFYYAIAWSDDDDSVVLQRMPSMERFTGRISFVLNDFVQTVFIMGMERYWFVVGHALICPVHPTEINLDTPRFSKLVTKTFKYQCSFPIYARNIREIADWVHEHVRDQWSLCRIDRDQPVNMPNGVIRLGGNYTISFENYVDAVHYKLRWH
jgi:hypothetical protein